MVIRDLGGIHHFDGFVNPGIERLPHRKNRLHSDFLQRILELTVDELNAVAEVGGIGAGFQCALETVEGWQNVLDDVGCGELAEILLFTHRALAGIVELRLQTGQAVEERVTLGLERFYFRCRTDLRWFGRDRGRCSFFAAFRSRKLVLQILALQILVFQTEVPVGFSVSFTHTADYSDSFKSLSNSRAMYDTADMVC